ncbi:hypothetical protein LINPERPRIM_LOCUS25994 [Linum perenne]
MRERVRERRRGFGTTVRSQEWGFSAGVRARILDLSLRALRIRGREIRISHSDRFVDAAYRISVTGFGSSHFVFVDLSLLRWIRDVLQEALQMGWKMGKEKSKSSGSRSIFVGSFSNNNTQFLRITELCKAGKRFFVAIPMDDEKLGWNAFLKSLQSILSEEQVEQCSMDKSSALSFASVVVGAGKDREMPRMMQQTVTGKRIQIEDAGVYERVQRLQTWVVVKSTSILVGDEAWSLFRKWLKKWWGWDEMSEIKMLGDESWLVDCGSEIQVEAILRRKWFFKGIAMEVCQWHSEAGRLSDMNKKGGIWILAFGIPVHLRAATTFKAVREACGGFIDCQETSFSAVRIKVKEGINIPTSVSLCYSDSNFVIPIVVEPLLGSGVHKGKEVALQGIPRCNRSEKTPSRCWPPAPFGAVEAGESSKKGEARVSDDSPFSSGPMSGGPADQNVSKVVGLSCMEGLDSLVGCPIFKVPRPLGSGLSELDLLREVASKPLLYDAEDDLKPRREAAMEQIHAPSALAYFPKEPQSNKFPISSLSSPSSFLTRNQTFAEAEKSFLPSFLASGRELDSSSDYGMDGSDSDDNTNRSEDEMFENLEDGVPEGDATEALVAKGRQMATILDLQLLGSSTAAIERVEEVAQEVVLRRSKSVPKSREERELRRINWGLMEPDAGQSSRRPRYVSSITAHNAS